MALAKFVFFFLFLIFSSNSFAINPASIDVSTEVSSEKEYENFLFEYEKIEYQIFDSLLVNPATIFIYNLESGFQYYRFSCAEAISASIYLKNVVSISPSLGATTIIFPFHDFL